jgi:tellurite resistance protein
MFLKSLSQREKEAFLELAYYMANIDGDFAKEEREMIDFYLLEMEIEDNITLNSIRSLDEILGEFQSQYSKKVAMLEIIGIVYSDDILDESEDEVLREMARRFNFSNTTLEIYKNWTKSMLALTNQGHLLLEI